MPGMRLLCIPSPFDELFRRRRSARQKSLSVFAAVLPQKLRLFLGFDALGDHFQAVFFRHGDDSGRDRRCLICRLDGPAPTGVSIQLQ